MYHVQYDTLVALLVLALLQCFSTNSRTHWAQVSGFMAKVSCRISPKRREHSMAPITPSSIFELPCSDVEMCIWGGMGVCEGHGIERRFGHWQLGVLMVGIT